MKAEDIEKLARLARISVKKSEQDALKKDVAAIVEYVSRIQEVSSETPETEERQHEHAFSQNVMREDREPHAAGVYTESLLRAAPRTEGNYIKVKKIL